MTTRKQVWILSVGGIDTPDCRAFLSFEVAQAHAIRLLRRYVAEPCPDNAPEIARSTWENIRERLKKREFKDALWLWNSLRGNFFGRQDGLRLQAFPRYEK